MIIHRVKVYPSKIHLPKKKQLAWKIAEIASDNSKLNKKSVDMVINRIIDNASVAIASLNRKAVISSREMALKHKRNNGATLFGVNSKIKVDKSQLDIWQLYGSLKWGIICMIQTFAHLSGAVNSLEKAAIGRRVSETEFDLMNMIKNQNFL